MRNYNHPDNNQKKFLSSLRNKFLVAVLIFLLIFSGYHFFRAKKKNDSINQEIAELQEQIEEFEKKNNDLQQISKYLQTDDFKEREAKENLDLVKEGEKVVVVKKATVKKTVEEVENEKPEVEIKKPNYYYWWHYFFGIKPETSSAHDSLEDL